MATETSEAQRVMDHLMTEKQLMQNVIDLARMLGCLTFHTYDSRRSEPGFPDLVIVGKRRVKGESPRVIFAELKSQTGRLSHAQRLWIEALNQCRQAEVYVWRPSDWSTGEIEQVLKQEAAA